MYNYTRLDPELCEFVEVGELEELPNGKRIPFTIDDLPIMLLNIGGEIFAIGDICTHDDGPLEDGEVEDHVIICPRHGARFDVRDGKVISLPAFIDIPVYPVQVSDSKIYIGIPKELYPRF